MKNICISLFVIIFIANVPKANAQLLDRLKKKLEEKIEGKVDRGIDDVLNKKSKKENDTESEGTAPQKENSDSKEVASSEAEVDNIEVWRNYKFIPGEKIIFYDDLKFEEVGEFPSRWDLKKGGAEVASFDGDKVIMGTAKYSNIIFPLFDSKNYLSDEFTVEFDVYVDELSSKYNNSGVEYNVFFSSERFNNDSISTGDIEFELSSGKTKGYVTDYDFQLENVSIAPLKSWHHVAISYYKGKFKMYFDEKRISNLPNLAIVPDMLAINFSKSTDGSFKERSLNYGIKNIRIAHGGGQMYKRIVANGRYSTNGILFETGKASMKPQSMGVIAKMVTLMNQYKDWNFQIIGHTDNVGDPVDNLKLSTERAEAVKQALIDQGVKKSRLSTLGKGESEPLNTNTSEEEKANNRRVEFVKQ